MSKTLLVIDASSLFYRRRYAMHSKPLTTSDGTECHGAYSSVLEIMRLANIYRPAKIVAAFEGGYNWRKEAYAEYKANRSNWVSESHDSSKFWGDFTLFRFVLAEVLNISTLSIPRYEADDVVASLATQAREHGFDKVWVLSGDRDCFQLPCEGKGISLLYMSSKKAQTESGHHEISAEGVAEWTGVPPKYVADMKALTGDASDNIPGVPGFGSKTAAKLIAEYGSIDAIYSHLEILPPTQRKKLSELRAQVFLSKRLATMTMDLDVALALEQQSIGFDIKQVGEYFASIGWKSFAKHLRNWNKYLGGIHTDE